ncbi:MAG: sigma-54-dependent Fis family transcriptional regulator [Phycisphaerae bacterium]|nr:sigma-54-dependent Fis family transcriptional regulator [Phycisphaerae bacterium]
MHTTPTACDNKDLHVLIVDDDPQVARMVLEALARRSIRGTVACSEGKAVAYADQKVWRLLLINPAFAGRFTGATLRQVIGRARLRNPELTVIALQEQDADASSNDTSYSGFADTITTPLSAAQVERLLDTFVPNHEIEALAWSDRDHDCRYRIVGCSAPLARTVELARKAAPTSAAVLIAGESGTGKELIAQLIHAESRRSAGPFVKVNCAALSDALLESELFGHEKGAFTGASRTHQGRFERAHGGTLLLDEITETQPAFQAKLLRVLEQMHFERVGGGENIEVNVRIISTTNMPIQEEVRQKRFRGDLYYRLAAVTLHVPPLRSRREDVAPLAWLFVNQFAHETARRITAIDTATLDMFRRCDWPGNVRQLRNIVRTALIFGEGDVLSLSDVPWLIEQLQPQRLVEFDDAPEDAGESLQTIERRAILAALQRSDGNQTRAARVLGITDRTLREKMKRYRNEMEPLAAR